jgi:hypothetical protein
MQTEWVVSLVVVFVTVLLMAWINRKSIEQAIKLLLTNPAVITNTENIVGVQPVALQETFKIIHRQMDLIETLVRDAGLIDTPIGRVIDYAEDFADEITNDTPYTPPVAPSEDDGKG